MATKQTTYAELIKALLSTPRALFYQQATAVDITDLDAIAKEKPVYQNDPIFDQLSRCLIEGVSTTIEGVRINPPQISSALLESYFSKSSMSPKAKWKKGLTASKMMDVHDVVGSLATFHLMNAPSSYNETANIRFQFPLPNNSSNTSFSKWVGEIGGSAPNKGTSPITLASEYQDPLGQTKSTLGRYFPKTVYHARNYRVPDATSKKFLPVREDCLYLYCPRLWNADALETEEVKEAFGGSGHHTPKYNKHLRWLYRFVHSSHSNRTEFGSKLIHEGVGHHRYKGIDFNDAPIWTPSWADKSVQWGRGQKGYTDKFQLYSPDQAYNYGYGGVNTRVNSVPIHGGQWQLAFWDKDIWSRTRYNFNKPSDKKPWGSIASIDFDLGSDDNNGHFIFTSNGGKDISPNRTIMASPSNFIGMTPRGNWKGPCSLLGAVQFDHWGFWPERKIGNGVFGHTKWLHSGKIGIFFGETEMKNSDGQEMGEWWTKEAPYAMRLVQMVAGIQFSNDNTNNGVTFDQIIGFFNNRVTDYNQVWGNKPDPGFEGLWTDLLRKDEWGKNDFGKTAQLWMDEVYPRVVPGLVTQWIGKEWGTGKEYRKNAGLGMGTALPPKFSYQVSGDAKFIQNNQLAHSMPLITFVLYCWLMDVIIRLETTSKFPYLSMLLRGKAKIDGIAATTPPGGLLAFSPAAGASTAGWVESTLTTAGPSENGFRLFLEMFGNLLAPMAELAKKLQSIQNANNLITSKSRVAEKGTADEKKTLVLNAQCFMLNTADKFGAKRELFSKEYATNSTYSRVVGQQRNLANVLFYNKEITPALLNASPLLLGSLQPKIRLTKKREQHATPLDRTQGSKIPGYKPPQGQGRSLEVNAPFKTFSEFKHAEDLNLSNPVAGRMFGAGITEVSISQEHGNRALSTTEYTTIEITFHFNRLDEIFRNWPVYNQKGEASYPYGYDGQKGEFSSIAELVFPLTYDIDDFRPIGFSDDNRHKFSVGLEVGWAISDHFKNQIVDAHVRENIKIIEKEQGSLTKEFTIIPYDSQFDIAENGTVSLRIKYKGIIDELTRKQMNAMFPMHLSKKFTNQTIHEKISKLEKKKRTIVKKHGGKPASKLQKIGLDDINEQIRSLKSQDKADKFGLFLSEQLEGFLNSLLDANVIHRVQIPKSLLGLRDQGGIARWSPYAEMAEFRRFNITKDKRIKVNRGWYSNPYNGKINSNNPLKDFARNIVELQEYLEKAKWAAMRASLLDGKNSKKERSKSSAFVKKAKSKLTEAQQHNVTIAPANSTLQDVDFIYFGDLVEILLGQSFKAAFLGEHKEYSDIKKAQASAKNNNLASPGPVDAKLQKLMKQAGWTGKPTDAMAAFGTTPSAQQKASKLIRGFENERLMFILGGIELPLWMGDKVVKVNVNVADVPIHIQVLLDFLIDNVIRPENYYVSYVEFVIDFWKFILQTYFSQVCFQSGVGIDSTQPIVNFFNLYDQGPGEPPIPVSQLSGKKYTKAELEEIFRKYQHVKDPFTLHGEVYNYCYLGGTTIDAGSFDYKKDLQNGIYHFYIGGDAGLVKRIEFKTNDIKGRAEAAFFSAEGDDPEKAMFMIPRLYDVTVTMVGNTLFESGQTFFVDPTMGTLLASSAGGGNSQLNLVKNTGLGGYYYISKVETILKAGEYETRLEGRKIGLALNSSKSKLESHTSVTSLEETMSSSQIAQQKAMQKQINALQRKNSSKGWVSKIGEVMGVDFSN